MKWKYIFFSPNFIANVARFDGNGQTCIFNQFIHLFVFSSHIYVPINSIIENSNQIKKKNVDKIYFHGNVSKCIENFKNKEQVIVLSQKKQNKKNYSC